MVTLKKHNVYILLGILLNSTFLYINRFNSVPDFSKGLVIGTGIGLMLIGIYSKNHDISKFAVCKYNLFNKVFGQ